MKDKQLEYFKRELKRLLDEKEERENVLSVKKAAFEINKIYKSIFNVEFFQKAGFGVGTVREWRGKKYKKIAQGKWRRIYESESRGAKISIARLKKQVDNCKSIDELFDIVINNTHRFSDENGKPLAIVKELKAAVDEKKRILNKDKPSVKAQIDDWKKQKVFGKNYAAFSHKGKAAIDKVLAEKGGYVESAFSKEGIGDIDVVWGKITDPVKHKGYGLAHIFDKHKEMTSSLMTEIIEKGEISETHNGYNIKLRNYVLGINKGYKENGKFITTNKWIVTSFEKKEERETSTIAHARDLTSEAVSPQNSPNNSNIAQNNSSVNAELSERASSRLDKGVAAIREKYEATKSVLGGKKSVILPNGEKIKCRYKIVEADAPTASHNEVTFESSENFPKNENGQNINDRDYQHDDNARMSVISIGNNYNALALQDLPVVTKDGVVVTSLIDENDNDGGAIWEVAFNPNQIKSATDNNGDFDVNSPSIKKAWVAKGRLYVNKAMKDWCLKRLK